MLNGFHLRPSKPAKGPQTLRERDRRSYRRDSRDVSSRPTPRYKKATHFTNFIFPALEPLHTRLIARHFSFRHFTHSAAAVDPIQTPPTSTSYSIMVYACPARFAQAAPNAKPFNFMDGILSELAAAAAASPHHAPAACMRKAASPAPTSWAPDADVMDTEAAMVFVLDVPGCAPSDISVEFDQGQLTISGARQQQGGDAAGAGKMLLRQRTRGAFKRTFRIRNVTVDADAISASLDQGVLTVSVPKVMPPAPRKVAVQPGAIPMAARAAAAAAPVVEQEAVPQSAAAAQVDEFAVEGQRGEEQAGSDEGEGGRALAVGGAAGGSSDSEFVEVAADA